jgi:dTDP-4-amino-4,6-dideoxygalactose transaminase
MNVPFFVPSIGAAERDAVAAVLDSGWLTTGPRCREFEEAFSAAIGAPHAHAVNSCTAALHLALEAIGIGRGDRVLVPSLTFAATAEVVRYLDAIPVFVDSDTADCNIDVSDARRVCERLAAESTPAKAIVVVHYGGQMVDMAAVAALARDFRLAVVEDAAHAFPAWIESNPSRSYPGALSDAACFSFYANKTITTGEGGMVVCRDAALMKRIRTMALHGIDRDAYTRYAASGSHYYEIVAAGYKYNLTDIAAALGLAQLRRADEFHQARAAIAARYTAGLAGIAGVSLLRQHADRCNAWHLFAVRIGDGARDRVIEALRTNGVTPSVHWLPLHRMPYYRGLALPQYSALSRAEQLGQELVSLPIYPGLSMAAVDHVCDVLSAAVARVRT